MRSTPRLALATLAALAGACGNGVGADAGGESGVARPDGAITQPDGAATAPDGDASSPLPGPDGAVPPAQSCAPLPPPSGMVIAVTPDRAGDLAMIVGSAPAGATISLADGTYHLGAARLQFNTAGVTLRSASGNAAAVVLDGDYQSAEIVDIAASNVTIAHVTITHAVDHPVHVYPTDAADVTGTVLYGLRIVDGGEQFVKVNPNAGRTHFVDNGRLECSLLQMTDAGRPHIERLGGTSCYTGGIDVHGGRGWRVAHNRFEGIYCTDGQLAEHAIHFWNGARDTLAENNVIVDCARGVGFGLGDSASGVQRVYADNPYPGVGFIGHYDGIIRNNVVYASVPYYDTGIELEQARGTRVFHNTIVHGPGATGAFAAISYRFANTVATIQNDLVASSGGANARIVARDGAGGTVDHNLEAASGGAALFTDAAHADMHLAPGATMAIDRGVTVSEAGLDLDGAPHTHGPPDLGADEAMAP